ncbi:MAG: peroxide stress protein YaaA [Bacillota bacterium]|nr:peroxide stress protein YaaA [Bacillota bacterium]
MQIIISPAKQMKMKDDCFGTMTTPIFLERSKELVKEIQSLDYDALKRTMKISDKLTKETYDTYASFDFEKNKTPALFAYSGIQYQYMAPDVLDDDSLQFLQEHLRILSGLYGILKPFDGIVSYRLEMQTKLSYSLYSYWKDALSQQLEEPILNLASEEYAKCIRKYKKLVDVRFCEEENGKLKEKGVYVKMARGAMVRYIAENKINDLEGIIHFSEQDYLFSPEHSNDSLLVFIRKPN